MQRYIIGFGWSDVDVIEAPSLSVAEAEAQTRSKTAGIEAEMLDECAWAQPWTDELAWEVGLYEPPTRKKPTAISHNEERLGRDW